MINDRQKNCIEVKFLCHDGGHMRSTVFKIERRMDNPKGIACPIPPPPSTPIGPLKGIDTEKSNDNK